MQTPVRLRGAYRGRHHVPVLATFRPTWRQALSRGVGAGVAGTGVLAVAALLIDGFAVPPFAAPSFAGRTAVWLAVAAPLPLGVLAGLALGRRAGVRLDALGLHHLPLVRDGFTPWWRVADVRVERRRRRTIVVLYLGDGSVRPLRAPYDGSLFGRDTQFERKLFMICHLWETHRTCRARD